jgi:hypothetical protein
VGARALPVVRVDGDRWSRADHPPLLEKLSEAAAVVVRGLLPEERCRLWTQAVYSARPRWTADFEGEQFSLGRAFYTHYETGRSALYFEDAARSDALVERVLPGVQSQVRTILGWMVGGAVRPRLGFCGPGVHVFPAGGEVALKGGVVHFDVEGLSPHQIARGQRAVTLVIMLQAPAVGGGIRIWDALHQGSEHPSEEQLAAPRRTVRYRAGDALFSDSLRLHQIRPFRGALDRISITAHAVEVDRDVWECWF